MGRGRREEACEGCGKESHGPRLGGRGAVRRTKDPVRKHILCNFEIPDEEKGDRSKRAVISTGVARRR
jgi:hypothetical protein